MDIHWGGHLVQKVELRNSLPMEGYMGMQVEILRDIHWESYLVQMLDLR